MGCAKEYLRISWFWDASEFIVYKICDFEIFQTLKLDGQYQEYSRVSWFWIEYVSESIWLQVNS